MKLTERSRSMITVWGLPSWTWGRVVRVGALNQRPSNASRQRPV